MGNCCKNRKSQNEEEKLILSIMHSLIVCEKSFAEIFQLIYKEEYNLQKEGPSDALKKIKKYEFLELAETHFYNPNELSNPWAKYHKDFFELISAKLSQNNESEIPCSGIIFLLLSFLKDHQADKMTFFNYITSHRIEFDKDNINNIQFIEVLKEYLRINLSHTTSVMCSIIIKNGQHSDKVDNLEKLRKVFDDQTKLNIYVDEEFPIKTNGERLETMETLKGNNFIFSFDELRSSFLSRSSN